MAQPGDFSSSFLNYSSRKAPANSLLGLPIGNRTKNGKLGLINPPSKGLRAYPTDNSGNQQ